MATQTYEQLIAGANKIKENELPESNTHNLVGDQLVQMTSKMQEESGKKLAIEDLASERGDSSKTAMTQAAVTAELNNIDTKFSELDIKTSSFVQFPPDGNLFDGTKPYVVGKYVNSVGLFADNVEYNVYAIPMNLQNIYVNFGTSAHLAACDKYGNVTHVNDNDIYTNKTLVYQEGDIYALVSVRNTEENPIISYQPITVSELPAGYVSNATFNKYKEDSEKLCFQGFVSDIELDSLIIPGIYQRYPLGNYNALYFVSKASETEVHQMRYYISVFGEIYMEKRKSINGGVSWSSWDNVQNSVIKSISDTDLDTLIIPGIYQRKIYSYSDYNILYFVSRTMPNDISQMKFYIDTKGDITISSRKSDDNGSSWGEWLDYREDIKNYINIQKLEEDIQSNFNSYQNLFDALKATTGVYLNGSDEISVNEMYAVSDYIPFTKGMKYLSSWVNGVANSSGSAYVFLYDKYKKAINSYTLDACKGIATWEEGVSLARFSIRNYQNGKVQIIIGKNKQPYRNYNNTLKTSLLGLDKSSIIEGTINSQQRLSLPLSYIRKNNYISAEIEGNDITNFKIGYGLSKQYQGWWIEVTTTEIKVYQNATSEIIKNTFEHGLTFGNKVFVSIVSNDTTAKVILTSNGKAFVQDINEWFGGGESAIFNGGNTSLAVKLSNFPRDAKKNIWLYGDSYFSYWQTDRWTHYMLEWGFNNFQLSHLPGINSTNMFDVLLYELSFGNPKYIVWCLGMNDGGDSDSDTPNSTWLDIISRLIEICSYKGIELILATIPSVPTKSHEAKNKWIRESGYRYIDFAKAVGATADGVWDNDYLSNDEIHPSVTGAIALASKAVVDFPEINI